MNGAKDTKENFLREIGRFVTVAEEVQRQVEHHPLMFRDQRRTREVVTRRATLHQRRFATADLRPADRSDLFHGELLAHSICSLHYTNSAGCLSLGGARH
jgi:hypothetical protein